MRHDLTDKEAEALVRGFREAIDGDRFPLSPRVQVLRAILARMRPEPARPAALREPRLYAPPRKGDTGGVDEALSRGADTPHIADELDLIDGQAGALVKLRKHAIVRDRYLL